MVSARTTLLPVSRTKLQIFLLSALLMALEEFAFCLEVMCFTLPLVEFMFDKLVILPVDELAPRFYFPFELFVACVLFGFYFCPVAEDDPAVVEAPSACRCCEAMFSSCFFVMAFIMRATSKYLG